MLLRLPLEERKKEIKHCDLSSLARAMESFPAWQVEEIASAMPPRVHKEFVRVVKIYKGEITVPKRTRQIRVVKKKNVIIKPLLSVILIGILIVLIEGFFPS